MNTDWHKRFQLILIIAAVLLFNYPVLAIADMFRQCCGVGVLPLYIFFCWTLIIGAAAFISTRER